MENRIFDKKNGLWYKKQGEYYLPCLKVSEEGKPVGILGQRPARYLRQNHKVLYMNLLTSGNLNIYLADIDRQAEEMFFRLAKQFAEKEGIIEKLKAEKSMEWIAGMNNIRSRAAEIVNTDLIYN